MTTSTGRVSAEVAVVGHGLVGAVAARCLAAAGMSVVMVDAGTPMGSPLGTHLGNLDSCRADPAFHRDLVRTHLRQASPARPDGDPVRGLSALPPSPLTNAGQRISANMPAAAFTHVLGGMGTLWNCVVPRLHSHLEPWPGITRPEWERLYERAEDLLHVLPRSAERSRRESLVVDALAHLGARSAPLAAVPGPKGLWPPRWTGPAEVLSDADPALIEVVSGHAVHRLAHRGGRVVNAEALALATGRSLRIEADTFLIAGGALRTPGLLRASGVVPGGGDSPLGRYLCEHPVSYGQVVIDPAVLEGVDSDPDPFVIVPVREGRPFHALLLCDSYGAPVLEGRVDERLVLSLYWYIATPQREQNRVLFDHRSTDVIGLPQPTFEYSLAQSDRARQREALEDLRAAGERIGTFSPTGLPRQLSPGSSMHLMGTTRMGVCDDGRSVADTYGRVWGFENLFLGGTGLIPVATATNPTLAACAVAVRTAEHIMEL